MWIVVSRYKLTCKLLYLPSSYTFTSIKRLYSNKSNLFITVQALMWRWLLYKTYFQNAIPVFIRFILLLYICIWIPVSILYIGLEFYIIFNIILHDFVTNTFWTVLNGNFIVHVFFFVDEERYVHNCSPLLELNKTRIVSILTIASLYHFRVALLLQTPLLQRL